MDNEPIQIITAIGVEIVSKPKEINLLTFQEFIKWKNLTIYPYNSKKSKMPFISIKDRVLYAYNHSKYKWFTIFNEIVDFLGCSRQTLNYHLSEIKQDGFLSFKENREEFDLSKKFLQVKTAQTQIRIIPYETFWALLEHYKSEISKDILKKLHEIDYERMMEDDNKQTIIEQLQEDKEKAKARDEILHDQLDECETVFQAGLFAWIFHFFPKARVEKRFSDNKKGWEWRVDIIIGDLIFELDGSHHRFDDKRFELDQEKDTFNFRNGRYTFRRSNKWFQEHWKEVPQYIYEFIKNNKKLLE